MSTTDIIHKRDAVETKLNDPNKVLEIKRLISDADTLNDSDGEIDAAEKNSAIARAPGYAKPILDAIFNDSDQLDQLIKRENALATGNSILTMGNAYLSFLKAQENKKHDPLIKKIEEQLILLQYQGMDTSPEGDKTIVENQNRGEWIQKIFPAYSENVLIRGSNDAKDRNTKVNTISASELTPQTIKNGLTLLIREYDDKILSGSMYKVSGEGLSDANRDGAMSELIEKSTDKDLKTCATSLHHILNDSNGSYADMREEIFGAIKVKSKDRALQYLDGLVDKGVFPGMKKSNDNDGEKNFFGEDNDMDDIYYKLTRSIDAMDTSTIMKGHTTSLTNKKNVLKKIPEDNRSPLISNQLRFIDQVLSAEKDKSNITIMQGGEEKELSRGDYEKMILEQSQDGTIATMFAREMTTNMTEGKTDVESRDGFSDATRTYFDIDGIGGDGDRSDKTNKMIIEGGINIATEIAIGACTGGAGAIALRGARAAAFLARLGSKARFIAKSAVYIGTYQGIKVTEKSAEGLAEVAFTGKDFTDTKGRKQAVDSVATKEGRVQALGTGLGISISTQVASAFKNGALRLAAGGEKLSAGQKIIFGPNYAASKQLMADNLSCFFADGVTENLLSKDGFTTQEMMMSLGLGTVIGKATGSKVQILKEFDGGGNPTGKFLFDDGKYKLNEAQAKDLVTFVGGDTSKATGLRPGKDYHIDGDGKFAKGPDTGITNVEGSTPAIDTKERTDQNTENWKAQTTITLDKLNIIIDRLKSKKKQGSLTDGESKGLSVMETKAQGLKFDQKLLTEIDNLQTKIKTEADPQQKASMEAELSAKKKEFEESSHIFNGRENHSNAANEYDISQEITKTKQEMEDIHKKIQEKEAELENNPNKDADLDAITKDIAEMKVKEKELDAEIKQLETEQLAKIEYSQGLIAMDNMTNLGNQKTIAIENAQKVLDDLDPTKPEYGKQKKMLIQAIDDLQADTYKIDTMNKKLQQINDNEAALAKLSDTPADKATRTKLETENIKLATENMRLYKEYLDTSPSVNQARQAEINKRIDLEVKKAELETKINDINDATMTFDDFGKMFPDDSKVKIDDAHADLSNPNGNATTFGKIQELFTQGSGINTTLIMKKNSETIYLKINSSQPEVSFSCTQFDAINPNGVSKTYAKGDFQNKSGNITFDGYDISVVSKTSDHIDTHKTKLKGEMETDLATTNETLGKLGEPYKNPFDAIHDAVSAKSVEAKYATGDNYKKIPDDLNSPWNIGKIDHFKTNAFVTDAVVRIDGDTGGKFFRLSKTEGDICTYTEIGGSDTLKITKPDNAQKGQNTMPKATLNDADYNGSLGVINPIEQAKQFNNQADTNLTQAIDDYITPPGSKRENCDIEQLIKDTELEADKGTPKMKEELELLNAIKGEQDTLRSLLATPNKTADDLINIQKLTESIRKNQIEIENTSPLFLDGNNVMAKKIALDKAQSALKNLSDAKASKEDIEAALEQLRDAETKKLTLDDDARSLGDNLRNAEVGIQNKIDLARDFGKYKAEFNESLGKEGVGIALESDGKTLVLTPDRDGNILMKVYANNFDLIPSSTRIMPKQYAHDVLANSTDGVGRQRTMETQCSVKVEGGAQVYAGPDGKNIKAIRDINGKGFEQTFGPDGQTITDHKVFDGDKIISKQGVFENIKIGDRDAIIKNGFEIESNNGIKQKETKIIDGRREVEREGTFGDDGNLLTGTKTEYNPIWGKKETVYLNGIALDGKTAKLSDAKVDGKAKKTVKKLDTMIKDCDTQIQSIEKKSADLQKKIDAETDTAAKDLLQKEKATIDSQKTAIEEHKIKLETEKNKLTDGTLDKAEIRNSIRQLIAADGKLAQYADNRAEIMSSQLPPKGKVSAVLAMIGDNLYTIGGAGILAYLISSVTKPLQAQNITPQLGENPQTVELRKQEELSRQLEKVEEEVKTAFVETIIGGCEVGQVDGSNIESSLNAHQGIETLESLWKSGTITPSNFPTIHVDGWASKTGSDQINQRLSKERAEEGINQLSKKFPGCETKISLGTPQISQIDFGDFSNFDIHKDPWSNCTEGQKKALAALHTGGNTNATEFYKIFQGINIRIIDMGAQNE